MTRVFSAVLGTCSAVVFVAGTSAFAAPPQEKAAAPDAATQQRALMDRYCIGCHNTKLKSGGLDLASMDLHNVGQRADKWEQVVNKLRAGLMPPSGLPRPDEKTIDGLRHFIEGELDRTAAAHPDPGRTEVLHRLNRTEYENAIRDLLSVKVKAADYLPADDSSNGFDNMAGTLRISQSLMERYLSAAKTIARLAMGSELPAVDSKSYSIAPDTQQHDRESGLPFGTRGGIAVQHLFPREADYIIKVDLAGAQNVFEEHQLEISVDGEQKRLMSIAPKKISQMLAYNDVDGKLEAKVHLNAGPHNVVVTFYRKPEDLVEQIREPFPNPRISGNDGGPGGPMPVVTAVTIRGPYEDKGAGDSPSRRRILTCTPKSAAEESACAKTIMAKLAHRAYRGPVAQEDLQTLMSFYEQGRKEGGTFDAGIELALRRLLVSPEFLLRVEADPANVAKKGAASVYRLSDLEMASRLSFFLWASIPDEELLQVAEQGKLKDPAVYEREVRRMLADPRSESLTTNFAGQWLQLRNLEIARPGDPFSLAFDETLRAGMARETELFFDSVVRENRPVTELLTANYTFLNQRLAEHYGIPGIIGADFRRVPLPADSPRRGILAQGSILTVTSQANRTSPVVRGKYILKNILGTPPPDPPPNVPALPDQKTQGKVSTLRERMAAHRANEPCATCHRLIDPTGFALENFDAIGRYRVVDESFNKIDPSGQLPDGSKFAGISDLTAALTRRPERFAHTVAERMLTYALGRGLDPSDMPAVRKIIADTAGDNFRMGSIVMGVVRSYPFLNRRVDPATDTAVAAVPNTHREPEAKK